MQVTAKLRHLKIAPRKVRLVADLIRRKSVERAQTILNFTIKKSAKPVAKLLNSAVANARNNFQIDAKNLFISKITVDEGPKFKRWMPRARGQAFEIQKRTSHITLILDEIKPSKKKRAKKIDKPAVAKEKEMEVKADTKEAPADKPKFKPVPEIKIQKPRKVGAIRRIFRRKSI